MLQINPGDKLPIIRQLNNPNDNTGYYVRAVVRNSLLQTVLKTIDLTDSGGGRFEGTYLVPPADGTYFDITTKVYSDVGYTTQDTMYADENNQYLGALRWGLQYWNAGTSGPDIDYKRIKKIVEDEVKKVSTLSEEDVSAIVSGATASIQNAITETQKAVRDIVIPEVKIPEPEKLDVTPVLSAVRELVPMLQEIDRKGGEVLAEEQNLMNAIGATAEAVQSSKSEMLAKQEEKGTSEIQLSKERDAYKEQLMRIRKSMGEIQSEYPEMKPDMENDEEEKRQKNISLRAKKYIR